MPHDTKASVREKTRAVLLALTEEERALLSRVLKVEREYLHQRKPRIKEDLLKAVRDLIKETP